MQKDPFCVMNQPHLISIHQWRIFVYSIRLRSYLVSVIVCTIMSGCSSPTLPLWSREYFKAIHTIYTQSLPNEKITFSSFIDRFSTLSISTPSWPSFKERSLFIPQTTSLSFRSFLSLQGCELSYLIGLRNSSLGRVMTASQRLMYEKRFLLFAPRCLRVDDLSPTVYSRLEKVIEEKRSTWPLVVWNAFWGSREWAFFFSTRWPNGRDPRRFNALEESHLLSLAQYLKLPKVMSVSSSQLKMDLVRQSSELESHLKGLNTRVGGRIIKESTEILKILMISYQALKGLNPVFNHVNAQNKVCLHLKALLIQYTQSIQPILSRRLKDHQRLNRVFLPFADSLVKTIQSQFKSKKLHALIIFVEKFLYPAILSSDNLISLP